MGNPRQSVSAGDFLFRASLFLGQGHIHLDYFPVQLLSDQDQGCAALILGFRYKGAIRHDTTLFIKGGADLLTIRHAE